MTTMDAPLSVLCFGAGAIGSYVGGSLSAAGSRVIFIERPEAIKTLRETGITVITSEGLRVTSNPILTDSIAEALQMGPFDVALAAVKSFDTPALAQSFVPFANDFPPVLSLQNGVENEILLSNVLGDQKVIAGTVTTAIGRSQAGTVNVERLRGIGITASHPVVPRVISAMNVAGLEARAYPQAGPLKWSKLLTNLLSNSTSAILDMPPDQIFSHPKLYRLEVAQIREALAVMHGLGFPVVNLPGTPVSALAIVLKLLPPALSQPLVRRAIGRGRGAKMPSLHIDLEAGRLQSEVEVLNGAVVRFGAMMGIPTPVNRLLTETLLGLVSGDLSRSYYRNQPERLITALQAERI